MKSTKNVEIRKKMKEAGLLYAELAEIMGVSLPTLFRILSSNLDPEDEQRIMEIINSYMEGKACSQKN